MEAKVYNQAGKEVSSVELPESVFGLPWNADLVHQVVLSIQSNARTPVAHAKDRSEVRGGGRKPWRQKGTGQARHGSRRSPIWRGGGATFGPRKERNYKKKINRKMRTKALYTVLSRKLKDGELMFVDSLALPAPKTKEAQTILRSLASAPAFDRLQTKKRNAALIALPAKDADTARGFRNIPSVDVEEVRNLNPVTLLSHRHVVVVNPEAAVSFWKPRVAASGEERVVTAASKKTAKKGMAKKTAVKRVAAANASKAGSSRPAPRTSKRK